MPDLKQPNLKATLKNSFIKASRIAILGIGSELRGDDAAGILISKNVEKTLGKRKRLPKIKVFLGETAPENLTGEIKRFKPSHLVIIDTVEIGKKAGTILVLKPGDVGCEVTFSTHTMPAKLLIQYLLQSFKFSVIILGVQPASIKFGASVSKSVKSAIKKISNALIEAVNE